MRPISQIRRDTDNMKKEGSKMGIGKYCIVRTYCAGVFAGELISRNGKEGVVVNARRLWFWSGAATLSELALRGVGRPEKCKFPDAVPEVLLTEIIEVIVCTADARASIEAVPPWRA